MQQVNGTKEEVLAVQLLLKADFTAPKPVVLQPYTYGHPQRGAFIEPDGRPVGYTHNKREFQRMGQRAVSLPPDARLLVLQTIYSPEVIDIHRGRGVGKVRDNLMFCNRHKLAVTLDGGMAALNAAEAQVGSVLANQAAAEAATQRPTRYQDQRRGKQHAKPLWQVTPTRIQRARAFDRIDQLQKDRGDLLPDHDPAGLRIVGQIELVKQQQESD